MATTYVPGDTVPKDGTVECTQYPGTRDKVKAGDTFGLRVTTGGTITPRAAPGSTSEKGRSWASGHPPSRSARPGSTLWRNSVSEMGHIWLSQHR